MQSTTVSTFKHFTLHPWLIAFIEQYSQQFEKLARKVFWVGYNRHFDATTAPQLPDKSGKASKGFKGEKADKGEKEPKEAKGKKNKKEKKKAQSDNLSSGAEGDVSSNQGSPQQTATTAYPDDEHKLSGDALLDIASAAPAPVDILGLETDAPADKDGAQDDGDEDDSEEAESEGKKKKGDKKKKDKGKKDKGKKGKQQEQEQQPEPADEVALDIAPTPTPAELPVALPAPTDADGDEPLSNSVQDEAQPVVEPAAAEPQVDFDSRDVFISTFLPLVKKHMNPKVYV
jgi:hypothetical protein